MNYQAAKEFILNKLHTELADHLYYHGVHHTLDVLAVTEELSEALDITAHDRMLLRTAALYHDAGFTIGSKEHEQLGCLLYTSPSPRDLSTSRMPSSA